MNPDEIDTLITKIVLMVFSSFGGGAYMSNNQEAAIAAGVGATATVLYGMYKIWNKKRVPETATVITK